MSFKSLPAKSNVCRAQEQDQKSEIIFKRKRTLTDKGRQFHWDAKFKSLKSKRSELATHIRNTLIISGRSDSLSRLKQEFSKARVLHAELNDIYNNIADLNVSESQQTEVECCYKQIIDEWRVFAQDMRSEIEHLEKLTILKLSDGGSQRSRSSRSRFSSRSKVKSVRDERLELEKKNAALEVKFAFARLRVEQEEQQERLKLRQEIAENEAKLNVCRKAEREEIIDLEQVLDSLPPENKEDDLRKFLDSQIVEQLNTLEFTSLTTPVSSQLATSASTPLPMQYSTPCLTKVSTQHTTAVSSQPTSASTSLPMQYSTPCLTKVSTQHTTPASSQATSVSTSLPMYYSTPCSTQPTIPASSQATSSFTSLLLPELSPIVPGYTSAPSQPSQYNPITEFKPATFTRNPFVNSDEQYSPQVPNNTVAGWEKVATSLEHCVTKLIASSEKIALANVSQSKESKSSNNVFRLPAVKIPVFNGEPLEYPVWSSAFKALVDSREMDADTKLNLLNQYVSGSPKQVVEHYLLIGTEDAYVKAKSVLQERYGNGNVVSTAFLSKLEKWPKVGPRDASGLREFSDFLDKIVAARKTVASLGILDYAKENAKLVAKLPYHLESRWRDIVTRWRSSSVETDYPSFCKFADFVRESSDKANIPELENLSKLTTVNSTSHDKGFKGRSVSAFTTTASSNSQSQRVEDNITSSYTSTNKCWFCKETHELNDCKVFRDKTFHERKNFVFRKRLCMRCAKSTQHQAKDCKSKVTCTTCGESHPTCLHKEKPKEAVSNCISVCNIEDQDGPDNAMIVPVWVRLEGEHSKEILQYAVLDDQANVSFISETLCSKLNVTGTETTLKLTTVQEGNVLIKSRKIRGLEILDHNKENTVKLPIAFSRPEIPAKRSQIPKPDAVSQWNHLKQVSKELMPYRADVEVSLLIGSNCTKAIRPRQIVAGEEEEPYGQKTILGWGVIGRICKSTSEESQITANCHLTNVKENNHFVFYSKVKEIISPEAVINVLATDFNEHPRMDKPYSVQDKRFVETLEDGIRQLPNGHYEMPLPLKTEIVILPNNRPIAVKRWNQLQARFTKSPKFLKDYQAFMKDVVEHCAEKVPDNRLDVQDGRVNYVPHTGVYHPKKKDKIRVVFDCSARFDGTCINDHLLQGPDFMNDLPGILCRFRKEEVAFATDIQGMFHQFMVPEKDRDLLRFLWWQDGDPAKDVVEYRMKVHLFGATSSPGCANFGLKRAADDGESEFGKDAAEFIRQDFYVDDGLKSEPTITKAVDVIKNSQAICAKAGLRLHKVMSNKREVLEAIPLKDRAQNIRSLSLETDRLPMERVLGVSWCVESDTFGFRIELNDKPLTRRGILSTVGSIFDPLGFVGPVTMKAKQILQRMCRDKLDWDAPVPDDLRPSWEQWRREIVELDKLKIPRCVQPNDFGELKAVETHHFSDASSEGYGQCSYLRVVNKNNKAHCSFIAGKSRVAPLKQTTIPRLELAAATLSARMSRFLSNELMYPVCEDVFWTDSQVVLGYINNEARKFHVFVANRVQQIRNLTEPTKWFYVESGSNPADDASRGLSVKQLTSQQSRWLNGPDFLWKDGVFEPQPTNVQPITETDPDVKKVKVLKTSATQVTNEQIYSDISLFSHVSSWSRLLRVVALCLRFVKNCRQKKAERNRAVKSSTESVYYSPTAQSELDDAKTRVIRCVQNKYFKDEIEVLQAVSSKNEVLDRESTQNRNKALKKSSCLFRLDPFLDKNGVIHVGGRIKRANIPMLLKHPFIIPQKNHVVELLVRHYHGKVQHMGRTTTHNELRQQGYWIHRKKF